MTNLNYQMKTKEKLGGPLAHQGTIRAAKAKKQKLVQILPPQFENQLEDVHQLIIEVGGEGPHL